MLEMLADMINKKINSTGSAHLSVAFVYSILEAGQDAKSQHTALQAFCHSYHFMARREPKAGTITFSAMR